MSDGLALVRWGTRENARKLRVMLSDSRNCFVRSSRFASFSHLRCVLMLFEVSALYVM
jgi:hypothetical protein